MIDKSIISQLINLKELGDKTTKKYYDCLTKDNVIEIKDYLIGYLIEDMTIKGQKTLSISRLDKESFELDAFLKEIPEIQHAFNIIGAFSMKTFYESRGHTILFILD